MTKHFRRDLLTAACAPYRRAGRFAWYFAKGKLGGDPIFFGLLEHGLIPDSRRLIDLGCGQGLLASWLRSARALYESGNWPAGWPAAPKVERIWGLELMPSDVERARNALGSHVEFAAGDIRHCDFGKADVVVILDVLHYIDHPEQEAVLRKVRAALPSGGTFITRVGDASGGLLFHISNWVDRVIFYVRGHRQPQLHCRTLTEWEAVLEQYGFSVHALPMSKGTPFANVMLVARAT